MRVTKPRRDFGDDNFSFTEKDHGDGTFDLKISYKLQNQQGIPLKRRELEIGL